MSLVSIPPLISRSLGFGALLVLWAATVQANDSWSRHDPFEHTNLASIYSTPGWSAGTYFDPLDMFGGELGTQEPGNGEFLFSESVVPDGLIDWVEFQTKSLVPLEGFVIGLRQDIGIPNFRAAARVVFKADTNQTGQFVVLADFVPDYTPLQNFAGHRNSVSESRHLFPNRVLARSFRVEFYRTASNPTIQIAPRIIEIDGIATPNPEPPSVAITNLPPGLLFLPSEEVPVGVAASDPQGILRVDLYVNGSLTDSSDTDFRFKWSNPYPGSHSLMVKVTDKLGGESADTVQIEVAEEIPDLVVSPVRQAGGYVHFDISGAVEGRKHVVLVSSDSINWSPILTNRYPSELWTFSEPLRTGPTSYRVEHQPNLR